MRKADYATLADIIRGERASAAQFLNGTDEMRHRAEARMASTERVARDFASRASVDRAAFLEACGIE